MEGGLNTDGAGTGGASGMAHDATVTSDQALWRSVRNAAAKIYVDSPESRDKDPLQHTDTAARSAAIDAHNYANYHKD